MMPKLLDLSKQLIQITGILTQNPAFQDWLRALLLSLAFQQGGNQAKADSWHEEAVTLLAAGRPEERRAGEILAAGEGLRLDEVDEIICLRTQKAALLVAMAARLPAERAELLTRAEELNVPGLFPYRFLKGAVDWLKE